MSALRSLLYLPASRPRMLAKLPGLAADAVLVDLEDGVAPAEKERARSNLRRAAADGLPVTGAASLLRINPSRTPWHQDDMLLAAELRPGVTVLPKAEEPEQVRRLAGRCEGWGGKVGLMIETARGVGSVRELAGAHPAVELLIYGSADYGRSVGARPRRNRDWELLPLQEILLAARMRGCRAVDSVYFHYTDREGLEEHARVARELGYDGKSCIHPDQVEPIHAIFSSTESELEWARGVRRAWEEQEGSRRGVVVHDGEMIEALHLEVAERILEREGSPAG
jgi:citrate lyase beta subunit